MTWAFLTAQWKRIPLPVQEKWGWSLGQEDPLENEMATHSSILAWEIPSTEEPRVLQFIGSQRVGQDLASKQEYDISCVIYMSGICILQFYMEDGETAQSSSFTIKRSQEELLECWASLVILKVRESSLRNPEPARVTQLVHGDVRLSLYDTTPALHAFSLLYFICTWLMCLCTW